MFDITKVQLGADDAEEDLRLSEYFLDTSEYVAALKGEKTIIAGRKGSGKSAIANQVGTNWVRMGIRVTPVTPALFDRQTSSRLIELGQSKDSAHAMAWQTIMLLAALASLDGKHLQGDIAKWVKRAHKAFKGDAGAGESFAARIRQTSFNAGMLGFTLGASLGLSEAEVANPALVLDSLKSVVLTEWPHGSVCRLVVDRIDDHWDGTAEAESMVCGLLLAGAAFNRLRPNSLKILTVIRSDFYDQLLFNDKDKLRQYVQRISWDRQSLKRMICERVRRSPGLSGTSQLVGLSDSEVWSDMFASNRSERYLFDRTFMKPRDALQFVRGSLERACSRGHSRIQLDDIKSVEEDWYSAGKLEDLLIENLSIADELNRELDALRDETPVVGLSRIRNRLSDLSVEDPDSAVRRLYSLGAIGVQRVECARRAKPAALRATFAYEDSALSPLNYANLEVHPSLRSALNVHDGNGNG